MEIIRKEIIHFSKAERESIDMTLTLMGNLENIAFNPEIVRHAENIIGHLSDLFDYVEEF